jgi:hypothetical protein
VKVSLLVAFSLGLFALLLGPVVLFPGTFLEIGLPRSYLLLVAALLIGTSLKEKKQDLL